MVDEKKNIPVVEQTYSVASIQMVSGLDWRANLQQALSLMQQAVDAGAQLIVLPENWAVFNSDGYLAFAQDASLSEEVLSVLETFSLNNGVFVCAGSLPVPVDDRHLSEGEQRALTRCSLIGSDGARWGAYDKLHLFSAEVNDAHSRYDEGQWFLAGHRPAVIPTPLGTLGLAICYDLRFPELFRWMASQGAEVFLVPSAFTYVTGEAHWSVLTRARALENLAYLVASNQGGQHTAKRQTWGHSAVVDPWGVVLAEHKRGPGLALATIDLQYLAQLRAQMPVLSHRRFDISEPNGPNAVSD